MSNNNRRSQGDWLGMEIMKLITVICDGWGILQRRIGDSRIGE